MSPGFVVKRFLAKTWEQTTCPVSAFSRHATIKLWSPNSFRSNFSFTFQRARAAYRSRRQPALHRTHESICARQPPALPRLERDGSAANSLLHSRARLRQFSWAAYADRTVAKANPEGQARHN